MRKLLLAFTLLGASIADDVTTCTGRRVKLFCKDVAETEEVSWRLPNQQAVSNDTEGFQLDKNALTILKASAKLEGRYSCNSGTTTTEVNLKVKSCPEKLQLAFSIGYRGYNSALLDLSKDRASEKKRVVDDLCLGARTQLQCGAAKIPRGWTDANVREMYWTNGTTRVESTKTKEGWIGLDIANRIGEGVTEYTCTIELEECVRIDDERICKLEAVAELHNDAC